MPISLIVNVRVALFQALHFVCETAGIPLCGLLSSCFVFCILEFIFRVFWAVEVSTAFHAWATGLS